MLSSNIILIIAMFSGQLQFCRPHPLAGTAVTDCQGKAPPTPPPFPVQTRSIPRAFPEKCLLASREWVRRSRPNPPEALLGAKEARVTPMMAQYLEIKTANADCLLFYRMGDFYELFFGDAGSPSRALGIALTKRGKHRGRGHPHVRRAGAAADEYLQPADRAGIGWRCASRWRIPPRPGSAGLRRWCGATWCAWSRRARSPRRAC